MSSRRQTAGYTDHMKRYIPLVATGSAVALIGEFVFNILVTGNYSNFLFTLFYYPIFLMLFYPLAGRFVAFERMTVRSFVILYFIGGVYGLALEWFVIGNSPWGNPQAFQSGQWSFHIAYILIPLCYLYGAAITRRTIKWMFAIYFAVSLLIFFATPAAFHLGLEVIWLSIFYIFLHIVYFIHIQRTLRRAERSPVQKMI